MTRYQGPAHDPCWPAVCLVSRTAIGCDAPPEGNFGTLSQQVAESGVQMGER
jgi:hypothetical protein